MDNNTYPSIVTIVMAGVIASLLCVLLSTTNADVGNRPFMRYCNTKWTMGSTYYFEGMYERAGIIAYRWCQHKDGEFLAVYGDGEKGFLWGDEFHPLIQPIGKECSYGIK